MDLHLIFVANLFAAIIYYFCALRMQTLAAQWHASIIIVHSWVFFYFLLFVIPVKSAINYTEFHYDEALRIFLPEILVIFASMFIRRNSLLLRDWFAVFSYLLISIATSIFFYGMESW